MNAGENIQSTLTDDLIREAQFTRDLDMMKQALKEHSDGKSRPAREYFDDLHAKLLKMKAARSGGRSK